MEGLYRDVLRGLALSVVLLNLLCAPASGQGSAVQLRNLDGDFVDPLDVTAAVRAVVLVFVSVDCPISNRYAPTVQQLHSQLGSQVRFWLIYPNPRESPEAIRAHLQSFGYPAVALRDPEHIAVKLAGATVTPEAAVFDGQRRMVYRGRIDDRYVAIGRERQVPSIQDLREALLATLAGRAIRQRLTPPVGCFIADFLPGTGAPGTLLVLLQSSRHGTGV